MEEGLSAMAFLNLPDSDTRKNVEMGWLEIANVSSTDVTDQNYWNDVCEQFHGNVGLNDTIKITMGSVTDYFKPKETMSLCDFLTTSSSSMKFTWSSSEHGPFHWGCRRIRILYTSYNSSLRWI